MFYVTQVLTWGYALAAALWLCLTTRPAAAIFAAPIVHLCNNTPTITPDSAVGDFVETAFTGYVAVSNPTFSAVLRPDRGTVAVVANALFTCSGTAVTDVITGYYVTDTTGAILYGRVVPNSGAHHADRQFHRPYRCIPRRYGRSHLTRGRRFDAPSRTLSFLEVSEMAIHKMTMFFQEFQRGWTETFYFNALDPIDAALLWKQQIATIMLPRAVTCSIKFIRALDTTINRRSFLLPVTGKGVLSPNNNPAPVTIAALLKIVGIAPQYATRHIWIRGLPQAFITTDAVTGLPAASAYLTAAITQYEHLMLNPATQWLIAAKPVVGGANVWNQVQIVTADPLLPLSTTDIAPFPGGPLPTKGQLVYFKGVPKLSLPGLKGNFTVTDVVPNTAFKISYRYKNAATAVFPQNMFWRSAAPVYVPVTRVDEEGYASRDTGRPFDEPRGAKRGVFLRA